MLKSKIIWFGVIAGTPMGLTTFAFILVFSDPYSQAAQTISEFQTFIAGTLALYAGVLTVIGVYFSATIPIRNARFLAKEKIHKNRVIGATILAVEVNVAMADILNAVEIIDAKSEDGFYNRTTVGGRSQDDPEIRIPSQLRSFEILATQDNAVAEEVARFLNQIARLNVLLKNSPLNQEEFAAVVDANHSGMKLTNRLEEVTDSAVLQSKN